MFSTDREGTPKTREIVRKFGINRKFKVSFWNDTTWGDRPFAFRVGSVWFDEIEGNSIAVSVRRQQKLSGIGLGIVLQQANHRSLFEDTDDRAIFSYDG